MWLLILMVYTAPSDAVKETLENPVTLRENGPVIAGVDWLHGR
jgi:hypothetical protein